MSADHGEVGRSQAKPMKNIAPPKIKTRPEAAVFGYALEKIPSLFYSVGNRWDRNFVLTMHDLGQLNQTIAIDWMLWNDEQREQVNAIYFSLQLER